LKVRAIVTAPPYAPFLDEVARHPAVCGLRLLRTVAGPGATVIWRTTLFPHWWPGPRARQRWGSFIAAALILDRAPKIARTDG